MTKRWILVIDGYEGVRKNAINMFNGYIAGLVPYLLPIKMASELTEVDINENNIIAVGSVNTHSILKKYANLNLIEVPQKEQSYSIFVGNVNENDKETYTIAIAGYDDSGVLYGCMEFINTYLGDYIHKDANICSTNYFENLLDRELNPFRCSGYPKIKTRALWTWGFVIYDYKTFFENMAKLKLNEVVIWNDYVPFNAKDVVEYAHSYGIKVVWGFSWGWFSKLSGIVNDLAKQESLNKIKKEVLSVFSSQYSNLNADGIYFQTFTEIKETFINGKPVAKIVTDLVNDIAGELFKLNPNLHIQFGLHATSVKPYLNVLKEVDKRIHIVWEDCGAFPYSYNPDRTENFDDTYKFTEQILQLRGSEERFGVVFKGMLNLDWGTFKHHHNKSYIMGTYNKKFIREREAKKSKIWKIVLGGWLKNADYYRKMIQLIGDNSEDSIVQALVEDGLFESKIPLPVAIYAQTLWDPNENTEDIIYKVSKSPLVDNE